MLALCLWIESPKNKDTQGIKHLQDNDLCGCEGEVWRLNLFRPFNQIVGQFWAQYSFHRDYHERDIDWALYHNIPQDRVLRNGGVLYMPGIKHGEAIPHPYMKAPDYPMSIPLWFPNTKSELERSRVRAYEENETTMDEGELHNCKLLPKSSNNTLNWNPYKHHLSHTTPGTHRKRCPPFLHPAILKAQTGT